jgi:uncharacterized low-complexity protein
MKKLIQLGLIIAGATALTFTMVSASENEAPKTMKCQAGKCGDGMKKDIKKDGKCNGDKDSKKEAPKKGKCGTGKCG